ncbi:MAG: M14 family metallocarboxypeptidase [Bdellovibrionaceae bacterium]|nr:M14 family metallocarboxypeptidase [Pseudobdellovibrionaceae bacterium]
MTWTQTDKENWFQQQNVKRSYLNEVVSKIKNLISSWDVHQYGALVQNPEVYPLFLIQSKNFQASKKTILITGGVHGYETSGVHGALEFMAQATTSFMADYNFVCAPCLSPWAYETINRWNAKAIDPNRSFYKNSPADECELFLKALSALNIKPIAHFDLHETTDTDNSVFRPALEQRDGTPQELWEIPDGFYLVGDSQNPQPEFQKAIITAVAAVTHIAPHDESGKIIGAPTEQPGVINYDVKKLFLCAGSTEAQYTTTTEVYPDSPKATPAICIEAQVAAIKGGLNYLSSVL